MNLIERLTAIFTRSSNDNQSPEEKARHAFGLETDSRDRKVLITLDYPEISAGKKESDGQTFDVKTNCLVAYYNNLSDDSSRHTWHVSNSETDNTVYARGGFAGSAGSRGGKDYDSFAEVLKAMQTWDQEQLSKYSQPAQEGVTRLSREDLKALVGGSFMAVVGDKPKRRGILAHFRRASKGGEIHWTQAAKEFGIQLPASAKDADIFAQAEIKSPGHLRQYLGRKPSI